MGKRPENFGTDPVELLCGCRCAHGHGSGTYRYCGKAKRLAAKTAGHPHDRSDAVWAAYYGHFDPEANPVALRFNRERRVWAPVDGAQTP